MPFPGPEGFLPGSFDVVGRLKTSMAQNVYEADFEYGMQPLRWENLIVGAGSIVHLPQSGGARLSVSASAGDIVIRQSRPYHRYQPGKAMYMATAQNFGPTIGNQFQRVGFFDDSNGVFFEQAADGMYCVIRSDASGIVTDVKVHQASWNGDRTAAASIDWNRIQMVWVEYAWYGAGLIRWGIILNGVQIVLHSFGAGNAPGQTAPWARTGNLPVRYELRNTGAATAQSMSHYGVSVLVEGRADEQRGFTYAYGMALGFPRRTVAAGSSKFPVLSFRLRTMGTQEYTQANTAATAGTTTSLTSGTAGWTVNQWQGRCLSYVVSGVTYTARITSNTATVLTIADVVTGGAVAIAPVAGQNYTIGLINRGMTLPRKLLISSSALAQCEVYVSTPSSPVSLIGASFATLASLGSTNSFAERDVSATAMSGGEKVMKFTLPAGGSGLQDIDLSQLFPLYNTIKGNAPDIMTLAVTTQSGVAADVGADFIAQEAMS